MLEIGYPTVNCKIIPEEVEDGNDTTLSDLESNEPASQRRYNLTPNLPIVTLPPHPPVWLNPYPPKFPPVQEKHDVIWFDLSGVRILYY